MTALSLRYSTGNSYLDAYLDHLVEQIDPCVPEEQRERLWLESADHLERLIEKYQVEGLTTEQATLRATELYGGAEYAAQEFMHNWFDRHGTHGLTRRFGRANMYAFTWFALSQVLYVVLLETKVFLPAGSPLEIPFSPAQVRTVWPEPLPFPDTSLAFFLTIIFPILVPFIAGWMSGRKIPTRAASAVYNAMIPLVLYSFVMGALMLPLTEGLLYALFQVVFWLPVGCLMAHLSSTMARKSRSRADVRKSERSSNLNSFGGN